MENKNWKMIAIMSIIINIIMIVLWIWVYMDIIQEEEKTYECYYEVCDGYHDAWYENNVCTCYELDVMGNYVVEKEKYMR